MSTEKQEQPDEWNAAIASRLGKLRSMPVTTESFEKRIADEMTASPPGRWGVAFRSTRAMAASLVLLASIVAAVMLTITSGAAYAEPTKMAAMHRDLVNGKSMVMQVDSVEAAERELTRQWPQSPDLPDGVPAKHVMACCLRNIDNKNVACVLLNDGGVPVSMMVAASSDVRSSRSATTIVRDGVDYHVSTSGELNMVMAKRGDRFVCLIGDRPVERLITLSSELRF